MRYRKLTIGIGLLLLFFVIIFLVKKYETRQYKYETLQYIETFNNCINDLSKYSSEYLDKRLITTYESPRKINIFLDSLKNHQAFANLLEYGVGYKYDSIVERVYIYSYGPDKIDDSLEKVIFNNWTSKDFRIQKKSISICDYEGDVIIDSYNLSEEHYLCDYKRILGVDPDLEKTEAFLKENSIVELSEELRSNMFHFQFVLNSEYKNQMKGIFFLKYENKKLQYLCDDDRIPDKLFNGLNKILIKQTEFDYAIFPLIRF